MASKIKSAAIPDEVKRTAMRNAVKNIPFINCGGFSITIVNANCNTYQKPASSGWHTHPFYEFSLVRRGVVGYRTKQKDNRRGPGEVHFMYPDCQHCWDIVKTPVAIDNFEIEFHAIDPAYAAFVRNMPDLVRRKGFTLTLPNDIQRLYSSIDDELIRNDALTSHRIPLIIYDIFHGMIRQNFPEWIRAEAHVSGNSDRAFRLFLVAKSIIDENIQNDIAPGEIARRLSITQRYLNELFGKIVQQPCGRYIKEHKLNRAYSMIVSDPTGKIREVAYALGYTDPLYFTRVFTEHFGISPTAVREHPQV
ncbi:MAG: helix-turn-helix transcriptional regulator [Spirochaetes bacterium]|nr:helix-turn-helix transcriptional regulator [Spirochaetota bacterium]